jgi:hypothetical protein
MVQENWLKVAARAMALGIGLYLVPLAMIANPALIGLSGEPWAALGAFVKVALGLGAVSMGVIAPLRPVRRVAADGRPRRGSVAVGQPALGLTAPFTAFGRLPSPL